MATLRLTFLYPKFMRLVRSCEPSAHPSLRSSGPSKSRRRGQSSFHSTTRRQQTTIQHRYGQAAAEPKLPPPDKPKDGAPSSDASPTKDTQRIRPPEQPPEKKAIAEPQQPAEETDKPQSSKEAADGSSRYRTPRSDAEEIQDKQEKGEGVQSPASPTPLDRILNMPPPTSVTDNGSKHPHLNPPPYVHHFDTYSLVQDLAKGDFTPQQAVTLMKAIRSLLAVNLIVARDSLVSKSDVENEVYLFRAACSELRTSLQSSRQSETQRQRTQRAHLQHEADILNQRMTQEMLGLREDLKAMFNDRKMATAEEKQRLDSKIQELNYEITVLLNSDSKSEVEGLRWILTRRAALAIGTSACECRLY